MQIKRCPFCGSLHVDLVQPAKIFNGAWAVYCDNCGALGGISISQDEAAECWNQRYEITQEGQSK